MDGSKIKNFVIYLLLALNVIFLCLVIIDRVSASKNVAQAKADLSTVMASNGVELYADIIPDTESCPGYPLTRDYDSEAALVSAVIGEAEGADQGGNIFYYENETGWARFRGNGEFEIAPFSPEDSGGRAETDSARALIKAMGLDVLPSFERTVSGGVSTLRFTCVLDGAPIYDCYVALSYENGALVSVTGRKLIGAASHEGAQFSMNPSTALLSLLSYIKDSGNVCSSITGIERGYSMSVSVSGDAELVPMWMVTTDAGKYYVNSSGSSFQIQTP